MKLAFFLLLFLNFTLFVWQSFQDPPPEEAPKVAETFSAGSKSIPLLHEVDPSKKSMTEITPPVISKPKKKPEPAKPVIDESPTVAAEPPQPLTEIEKKVAAVEARQAKRIDETLAARKNEERAAAAPKAPEPKPRAEPVAVATAPAAAVVTKCYSAGPFNINSNADTAASKLSDLGFVALVRKTEIQGPQNWWVLDATKDEREAQKRLAELRDKKVADAEIIDEGDYQNMISFGKFQNEADATKRINALVKIGFRPVVEKRFDAMVQYWMDYEETGKQKLSAEQWRQVTETTSGITRKERPCK